MARQLKVNAMALGHLMRALTEEPRTITELAELTGLHYHTVREWVNALHDQGVVFIAGYEKDRRDRDNAPLWLFGVDKRDAKKSKLTAAERQARVRARIKAAKMLNLITA